MAERLRKLQELTDALEPLALEPLLAELAVRIADLFEAEGSEVSVGPEGEQRTVCAEGGKVLAADAEAAGPAASDRAWLTASMQIERHGVGTVAIHRTASKPFTPAEQSLLHEAADRAALAIRQAELYEEEHRIAASLQQGLLPQHLPSVDGLDVSAHYQAGGSAAEEVGGDWYDAFALPGGRLGIVVGDVAGRGILAASTMGQMRSVTRAYALAEQQRRLPGEVLTYLNRYQLTLDVDHLFTVLYAVIDPAARTVTWASAGHLPPLLLPRSSPAAYLTGGGYPIGVEDVEYEDLVESLEPSGALVLYTDGLLERRSESLDVGFERLIQAAADGPPDPRECTAHLLKRMLDASDPLNDDVTVVLARLTA
jgi:serine phosphatase RsbU (regulator of sigma subunit)